MAFALAIKSKFDLPRVGSIFFLLTLVITAFTLIYSAFFLDYTLNQCDVIIKDNKDNLLDDANNRIFNKKDKKVSFNVDDINDENEKEGIVNHSFLHEDLDQYENNNYPNKLENQLLNNNNNKDNKNYFDMLKEKVVKFNEDYLIPIIDREERISLASNYSAGAKINLDTINTKDLKKRFLDNKQEF